MLIVVIALVITRLLYQRPLRVNKDGIKHLLVLLCGLFLCVGVVSGLKKQDVVVHVDPAKALPSSHYMAMGMVQDGGYYYPDVVLNNSIKDPKKRSRANVKLIKQRLKRRGAAGYLAFLYRKNKLNTMDVTFGWGIDAGAGYLIPSGRFQTWLIKRIPQKIFMSFDQNLQRVVANRAWNGWAIGFQLAWIAVILGLLANSFSTGSHEFLLKLAITGGLLYLLLFEGGRSRYLVQFLPFFVLIAAVSVDRLGKRVRARASTKKRVPSGSLRLS
mgnify:CR=1 FL=1